MDEINEEPKQANRKSSNINNEKTEKEGGSAANRQKAENHPQNKGKKKILKTERDHGLAKARKTLTSLGATAKQLWKVWGRFKRRNVPESNPSVNEKTMGVPGFEEIACIEAEVPDIMMTDKDRVRSSCKECMKDPPAFPTKEQIKAKLVAADKYYGVASTKTRRGDSEGSLEHEADYYDEDGNVVRPSWRFILERPLVEQYVLMTNYIRKVSVLDELKGDKQSTKFIEEEDSGSDTEYKKFEQKFIREKEELLKVMQKPKMQDMAIQTTLEPHEDGRKEDLKESISEISLYPETEESTNSPEASAVTIVTSRDYSSPLQSDFDSRAADRRANYKNGKWWDFQALSQPSESFQESCDSVNKNMSSGSDGQSINVHSTGGKTALQAARGFSNESNPQIVSHSQKVNVEPKTHREMTSTKKVSFSPVVTYYHGPDKNSAVYCLPADHDIPPEENQNTEVSGLCNNDDGPLKNQTINQPDELEEPTHTERTKPTKMTLADILQETRENQLVSVSIPEGWHEARILENKEKVNVALSKPEGNRQSKRRRSFQRNEDLSDIASSEDYSQTVHTSMDTGIQTLPPVPRMNLSYNDEWPPSQERPLTTDTVMDHRPSKKPLPITDQLVYRNSQLSSNAHNAHFTDHAIPQTSGIKPPKPVSLAKNTGHSRTESVGTETNIQSAQPIIVRSRMKTTTPIPSTQWYDNGGNPIPAKGVQVAFNVSPQQTNLSNFHSSSTSTHFQSTAKEYASYYHQQPMQDGKAGKLPPQTGLLHSNVSAITNLKQKDPMNETPRIIPLAIKDSSSSPQPQSTDTEGSSSTSNDHIKLKASPACFFRVATPTDLSKISVDEFYPEVPEIDAEISQTSEPMTFNAPHVEIVLPDNLTPVKMLDANHFQGQMAARKENGNAAHISMDKAGVLNNRNTIGTGTILVSPGVDMRIEEGRKEKLKDSESESKASQLSTGITSKINSSQQCVITQNIGQNSKVGKQSEGQNTTITKKVEKSSNGNNLAVPKLKFGVNKDNQEKDSPNSRYVREATNNKSSAPQKTPTTNVSQTLSPQKCHDNSKLQFHEEPKQKRKVITEENAKTKRSHINKSQKEVVSDRTQVTQEHLLTEHTPDGSVKPSANHLREPEGKIQAEELMEEHAERETIVKSQKNDTTEEKPQDLPNHYDSDPMCQFENIPRDKEKQMTPQGWTKFCVRTLSSLAEEPSSVLESGSSSAQEKLIDMPVIARSVDELKTIFEKKQEASAMLDESDIHAEGSQSIHKNETAEKQISSKGLVSEVGIESSHANDEFRKDQDLQAKTKVNENKPSFPASSAEDSKRTTNMDSAKSDNDSKPHHFQDMTKDGSDSKTDDPHQEQVSQIDVIKASQIYSNSSMYASSSEDRGMKLTKVRTIFQPMTSDNDMGSISPSKTTVSSVNEKKEQDSAETDKKFCDPSRTNIEERTEKSCSEKLQIEDTGPKEQGQGSKTKTTEKIHSVDADVLHNHKQVTRESENMAKERLESKEPPMVSENTTLNTIAQENIEEILQNVYNKTEPTATVDCGETKQWLMDVIPILSKAPRFQGFRPQKRISMKDVIETNELRNRQEAVKPVFKFLKRQREMDDNKE